MASCCTRPPLPLLHRKKTILGTCMLWRIRWGIIKFSNSITYFRNRHMLFCNLFIYHLPPSVILSVNEDSSILTHFNFPDTHSLKTECRNALFKTAIIVSQNSKFCSRKQGTDRLFPMVNVIILFIDNLFIYLLWTWICVTHKSTVARTVMCRQDGRGRFPVLLDDHSKCRTNSQRKSQLRILYMVCTLNDIYKQYNKLHEHWYTKISSLPHGQLTFKLTSAEVNGKQFDLHPEVNLNVSCRQFSWTAARSQVRLFLTQRIFWNSENDMLSVFCVCMFIPNGIERF